MSDNTKELLIFVIGGLILVAIISVCVTVYQVTAVIHGK